MPGNFSRAEQQKLGTIYRRLNEQGKFDEKAPWKATADDFSQGARPRETVFLKNEPYSLTDYEPGRNATLLSPQGGLRLSCEELSHALEMLMNNGKFRGRHYESHLQGPVGQGDE